MDYRYVTCDSEGLLPAVEAEQATHIARHDPARVLREVAAKRRLIADFADQSCLECSSMSGGNILSDNVVRALASAYSCRTADLLFFQKFTYEFVELADRIWECFRDAKQRALGAELQDASQFLREVSAFWGS
ncbi:DUF6221 family protein [Rhodococcus cercidiphylli]|uniref:DUF6221 family protein n=1 Tax=Rhodococcus cercidiphylli TaxID=489916 RepID=UPI00374F54B7